MKRIGFLPAFFVVLGVVFATMVVLRIRAYRAEDARRAQERAPLSMASSDDAPADLQQQDIITEQPDSEQRDRPRVPLLDPDAQQRLMFAQPVASDAARIGSARVETARPAPAAQPRPPQTAVIETATARPQRLQPQPQQAARPQETRPAQQASSQPSRETANRADDPAVNRDDPTSDNMPPQLATIEFSPPQIADGEETMLVIQATDDLSGIRSISGTIMAPSGAVQGFACQRDAATNRYIARVIVPKDAAEGVWAINYLNLMDNASNAAALTAARGALPPSASFRVVSSRPDSQGPTLQAIWLDRRSMRGGEKNLVFVRASDDNSGVNLISGIFQSPSRQARVGFVCRAGNDVTWSCEMTAPACADCGEWQLEQLQMQDKANNMTTLRANQNELVGAVRLDISSELCDATPPSIENVRLDRPGVSNVEQSTIQITAMLSDDACGVLSVSGQATGPQTTGVPPRLYFSFTATGEKDPKVWTGKIVVPRLAAKGVWRVSFLQVLDRGQNLKTYTANDPLLAGVSFVVD